jgi:hypothetical protein
VCVFITAGPSTKLFAWGGGGYWGTCVDRAADGTRVFLPRIAIR